MPIDYSIIQRRLCESDMNSLVGLFHSREEWNSILRTKFNTDLCFIHPQKGIIGNMSGTICIKSTKIGSEKYEGDFFRQSSDHFYYETQETKKNQWDDELVNKSIALSSQTKRKFLVFHGINKNLKLVGLGVVEEIFVSQIKKGKSAIFKIRIVK